MQKISCFYFYHPLLLCPLDLVFVLLLVWPTIAFSEFSIISHSWLKYSNHPEHTTISAGWLFKRCFHVPSNHMSAIMSVTFPPPHREKVIITHRFRASTLLCVLWALGPGQGTAPWTLHILLAFYSKSLPRRKIPYTGSMCVWLSRLRRLSLSQGHWPEERTATALSFGMANPDFCLLLWPPAASKSKWGILL